MNSQKLIEQKTYAVSEQSKDLLWVLQNWIGIPNDVLAWHHSVSPPTMRKGGGKAARGGDFHRRTAGLTKKVIRHLRNLDENPLSFPQEFALKLEKILKKTNWDPIKPKVDHELPGKVFNFVWGMENPIIAPRTALALTLAEAQILFDVPMSGLYKFPAKSPDRNKRVLELVDLIAKEFSDYEERNPLMGVIEVQLKDLYDSHQHLIEEDEE